jgi:hypothetical protein
MVWQRTLRLARLNTVVSIVAASLALLLAPFARAELAVWIDPASPSSTQTFDLRAFHTFGDPGQRRIEQSITVAGNQIDVYVLMRDMHCCGYVFPQVIWDDGAFFDDYGPLAAGDYHLDAEMWMQRSTFPFTTYLLDTGSLDFSVTGDVGGHSIPGDFNDDGLVDAGDYVVVRKGLGTQYSESDIATWRANFGQSSAAGGGAGGSASVGFSGNGAVPEPASLVLLLAGSIMGFMAKRR